MTRPDEQVAAGHPLRALIVDDEALARRRIRRLLEQDEGVDVVGECTSGREAIAAIAETRPDLLFLDIRMPGCDGFEVLRTIDAANLPFVVFVTAHDDHAVRAFDVQAVDYLLKPIDGDRLRRAVSRAAALRRRTDIVAHHARVMAMLHDVGAAPAGGARLDPAADGADAESPHVDDASLGERADDVHQHRAPATRLLIRTGGRIRPVRATDVDWAEALGNYARIHHHGRTDLLRTTLASLERRLGPARFCRIHRSAVVNLDRVAELQPWGSGDSIIVLADGVRLRVSRRYRLALEQRLAAVGD